MCDGAPVRVQRGDRSGNVRQVHVFIVTPSRIILNGLQCNPLDSVSIILFLGHCVSYSVCRLNKVTAVMTSLAFCNFMWKFCSFLQKPLGVWCCKSSPCNFSRLDFFCSITVDRTKKEKVQHKQFTAGKSWCDQIFYWIGFESGRNWGKR